MTSSGLQQAIGTPAGSSFPNPSMSSFAQSPRYSAPPPPPKPAESRTSTPRTNDGAPPLPPPPTSQEQAAGVDSDQRLGETRSWYQQQQQQQQQQQTQPDPGEQWLPAILKDKSKPDLHHALSTSEILNALSASPSTLPPTQPAPSSILLPTLQANQNLAAHVLTLEEQLRGLRASAQAQLLQLHHLERSWRQSQSRMDTALSPFSPSALYQRLVQAIQEQEEYCRVLEESFLEGEGKAGEKEVTDWIKGFREGRKLAYKRVESKARWDEGRVGGWR